MWIFLSPHLDDAVYSCGGLIHTLIVAGDQVAVWTLFAGDPPSGPLSPFAKHMHARWGLDRSFAVRRAEDERACAILAASHRHFPYPDCIYRRRKPDRDLLYPTYAHVVGRISRSDGELADRLFADLKHSLPPDARVVCPLGIGNHVDHMLTRLVAERTKRPLFYFEDLPYVAQQQWMNDKVLGRAWQSEITPLSPNAMDVWQSAAAAYDSQLELCWRTETTMRQAITRHVAMANGARLWRRSRLEADLAAQPHRERKKLLLFPHHFHPISPRMATGGAATSMFELGDALHRAGVEVTLVAALIENCDFELNGVHYHNVAKGEDVRLHLSTLTSDGCNAIIAQRGAVLVAASRYFPFAARILRLVDAFWGAHEVSAKQINGSVDAAVAVSDFIGNEAIEWGIWSEKIRVVRDGLRADVFRRLPKIKREDNLVVFAGATLAGKGIGHLVVACVSLMKRVPDLRLEVYGSVRLWIEREEEIDWAKLTSIQPNIVYKGAVGREELVRAFNRASVCVVPTDPKVYSEGFPRVSTEAQGCGCPVIVSRSGGLPESIIEGETGVIVEPLDSEHLAATIGSMLADGGKLRVMSRAAERSAGRFTVDDSAQAFLRIVEDAALAVAT